MTSRRLLIAVLVLVLIGALWAAVDVFSTRIPGAHQRSVTRELAAWAVEYGVIQSHDDAVRTAEMLGYVQHYYVVQDGCRSTADIEAALESQREETVAALIAALREYSGADFGADSDKWLAHLSAGEEIGSSLPKR